RAHQPPDRSDVPGPDRRDGTERRLVRAADASVYESALRGVAAFPSGRPTTGTDRCRRGPERARPTFGLSLPSAVPGGDADMLPGCADLASPRWRRRGGLPPLRLTRAVAHVAALAAPPAAVPRRAHA